MSEENTNGCAWISLYKTTNCGKQLAKVGGVYCSNDQYKVTTVNRCSGLRKNGAVIFDIRSGNRNVCPVDSLKGSTTSSVRSGMIVSCPINTIEKVAQAPAQTEPAE